MASALLVVGAIVGFTVVAAPATPASAACSSVVDAKYVTLNGSIIKGWKLAQSTDCNQRWGQIVIDYVASAFDTPLAIKIERQIKSPYGYFLDEASTKTKLSAQGLEGTWNTTHITNSSGDADKHRICYGYGVKSGTSWVLPSTWDGCTSWVY
ncbi:hypothetical protein [Micromonospora narathiwatensis]|uniref:hypothetical protein n=1 Tax=Micromonospora narathiwatensis TaxID=299146 RepID=UPI000B80F547|nr:hypothetical protein [Micromonospora narathiwatensis]